MRAVLFHGTKKILHADDVTSAAQQKELHNIAGEKKRGSAQGRMASPLAIRQFSAFFFGGRPGNALGKAATKYIFT